MSATLSNASSALRWYATFRGRLSLLFIALMLTLTAMGVGVWRTIDRFIAQDTLIAHTLEVQSHTQAVVARMGMLQAAATVYATTGAPLRAAEFTLEAPALDGELDKLADLVAINPTQVQRVHELGVAVRERRDLLIHIVAARHESGTLPVLPEDGPQATKRIAAQILEAEDSLLTQRRLDARRSARQTRMLVALTIVLGIVFLSYMFWLIRSAHRRSERSEHQLRDSNAQLAEALTQSRRTTQNMQHLSQFGEMLQACRSLNEVREGIPAALGNLLPGMGGRMALFNPAQNLLSVGAHWGSHGLIAESVFAPEDCWALRRGQAYPLADSNGSSSFVCKHVHWPNPDRPNAQYLCVPLAAQGEVIGVLTFDAARALTLSERPLAVAAAEQLALALANLRLQTTLHTQSIRDPLTGLFNRRYLEVSLERELARANRHSQSMAILMLDLDHFKRFNDSWGHDAGDAVLVQFADVLKRNTRAEDIACRYGGEEFTVILLETDADTARKRAEQIRIATAQMTLEHRQQPLDRITVSIGIALFPQDARSSDDLLRRADSALYRAKHAGRNRVVAVSDKEMG